MSVYSNTAVVWESSRVSTKNKRSGVKLEVQRSRIRVLTKFRSQRSRVKGQESKVKVHEVKDYGLRVRVISISQ